MSFGQVAPDATKAIYTCDICGESGRKGLQTMWFGSLADEDCGTLVCLCDHQCALRFAETPHKYYRPMRPWGYDYKRRSIDSRDLKAIKTIIQDKKV